MNKYQKQIYKIAKWSHKAVLKNSNTKETFKKHYRGIKRCYSDESWYELKQAQNFYYYCFNRRVLER